MKTAALLFLPLLASLSFAHGQNTGSGSKASQSLLELGDPIPGCLLAGAMLTVDPAVDPVVTIDEETETQIWAVTFDQTWLEVEHDGEYFFVSAEQSKSEAC